MQEFSSISVSSYEASALADRLTEQATEGWSVVAIVPTGSTVTAYLSRDGSSTSAVDPAAASATPLLGADESVASTGPADEPGGGEAAPAPADPGLGIGSLAARMGDTVTTGEPVTEAPGWAAGSSASTDTAEPVSASAGTPSAQPTPAAETTVAAETAAAANGAAPAGWYADPSSRFELRYWDGSQWTEHVSRSGQQFTDPPVA